MNLFKIYIISLLLFACPLLCEALIKPKTIGIVIPIALPAMDQIVQGLETEMKAHYPYPVKFILKNAQGNTAILQSILQQFNHNNVDLIAPIGTNAAQMAIHMIKTKPIVAVAAKLPPHPANNVTDVLDEVSADQQISFIHQLLPILKKITLIYSSDDRIFTEIKKAQLSAKQNHIELQTLMINTLPDLYSMTAHINPNSQAILILKDELVVSGIRSLIQKANAQHIIIISSDDGSVEKGAGFAFGVRESDIGKNAADLIIKIFQGQNIKNIPSIVMKDYTVFINPKALSEQRVDVQQFKQRIKKLNYTVVEL